MSRSEKARGFSLVEIIVFVVVLAVGFAGILVLYNRLTSASVDPLVRKQALAIATSLLEEIQLRAFTYCDPDDPNVYTATSAAAGPNGCTAANTVENLGAEAGETRSTFDNVNDYNGFSMGAGSISTLGGGAPIAELSSYSVTASVAVIDEDELPTFKTTPNLPGGERPKEDALRITVTATHPGTGVTVSLQGYRTRYAPNSP